MKAIVGVDVGSLSAKLAAIPVEGERFEFEGSLTEESGFLMVDTETPNSSTLPILISKYRRTFGNPVQTVQDLFEELAALIPRESVAGIRVTGSGAGLVADALGARRENEFKAIANSVSRLYPETRTVFEIGGESSKYFRLSPASNRTNSSDAETESGAVGITDYATSGECAAGTGAFLDQQAMRLQYRVEEIGTVVANAKCTARIAGRCSVFAKSDMIHAQQRGYGTDEVLKGLCEAVARNFKSNIVRGRPVVAPVALIGAVSQNSGVVQALMDVFHLEPGSAFVPDLYAWLGAIGCAFLERSARASSISLRILEKNRSLSVRQTSFAPLCLENVLFLRDHPEGSRLEKLPEGNGRIPVYLGIDIGSVSTNLVLVDEAGRLLHEIYLYTAGRPTEAVDQGLREIERLFGTRIEVRGVGTTGSGRELIGELVGADTVNDEITAHKTGAVYVHEKLVRSCMRSAADADESTEIGGVDTIFEIGGQDAKYISIDRGVVVDFAMNEACAAGTGSFLEEQAERLGIQIKGEFAQRALTSRSPARLGERCTVFMERDVTAAMQRGASVEDLAAGLAYSVALNYLNRVVRGRKIGNVIYFQGGTAYNDAVAAAFSQILGKRVIVPPHNGVIGAIGMALIAQEASHAKARASDKGTVCCECQPISTFRGFDLNQTRFETREFICKACSNYCEMKEITVEGRKTYWGDKCSDKFRKRARTDRKPVVEDLLALRDQALTEGYSQPSASANGDFAKRRVGIPRAMFFFDRFPFWRRYLEEIDFAVEVSPATNSLLATRGVELAAAEPCFPVQIAHGHVQALLKESAGHTPVDYVFLPNVMDMEAPDSPVASHLCPWNQTLPFVVRSAPAFEAHAGQFLAPTVYFRLGRDHVKRQLGDYFNHYGIGRKQSDKAVDAAYAAQAKFTAHLMAEGQRACETLESTGEPAILLVGRPYNIYDRSGNCDVPRKLRDLYGINVLPIDFLPLDAAPVDDLHTNMFWNSGRRILAAGRFARQHRNVHIIYITNFKCGPDSFVKFFLRDVAKDPFLILQFDGHGNDAGYLTRCEAYLDSKGLLRCSVSA